MKLLKLSTIKIKYINFKWRIRRHIKNIYHYGIKFSLLWFVVVKIAKIPEGEITPKWCQFLEWILFPLKMYVLKNGEFNYEMQRLVFTINGIHYSAVLFSSMRAFRPGDSFEIIKKENGVITVRRLNEI